MQTLQISTKSTAQFLSNSRLKMELKNRSFQFGKVALAVNFVHINISYSLCSGYFLSSCCTQTRGLILFASVSSCTFFFLKHWSFRSLWTIQHCVISLLATLSAVSKLIDIFQIGNFCFWVPFFKRLLLKNCAVDFVEICNVCARKVIIKVAKRMFNSDKISRSYCDFYFGVTFFGTQCMLISVVEKRTTEMYIRRFLCKLHPTMQ